MTSRDEFLTSDELVELLRIDRGTLWRWRREGDAPPAYKFGRQIRFKRSEVDAWIEAHHIV